ncbi:hypothetical protein [Synechococcus sp. MIT S1220]|uniref:hypothetical protein n=1 Tax=Synechococcus sp. MIT S1220 TaxID=3082549 RepID=UPI0039AF57CF
MAIRKHPEATRAELSDSLAKLTRLKRSDPALEAQEHRISLCFDNRERMEAPWQRKADCQSQSPRRH